MNKIFRGVRPSDAVVAALATGLGVWLMVENIDAGPHPDVRVDSTSWLLVPVWLVATVPLLWRRRSPLTITLVAIAAMTAHVLAFDWVVRCGAGLPLTFLLAYAAGRFVADRWSSVLVMALTIGLQAVVLVRDSAAGIEILPFTAVLGAVCWGAGLLVGSLIARRSRSVGPAADVVPVA